MMFDKQVTDDKRTAFSLRRGEPKFHWPVCRWNDEVRKLVALQGPVLVGFAMTRFKRGWLDRDWPG